MQSSPYGGRIRFRNVVGVCMSRAFVACLVAGSLLVPLGASGPAQAKPADVAASTWSPSQPPADLTEFYKEIGKSVVTVVCGNSSGSGWAARWSVSNGTTIYTNEHVVTDCGYGESVLIVQGDKQWTGELRGKNADVDYAYIYVDAFFQPLQAGGVRYPVVGQWVAAFGSPLGLAGSMTTGTVSFVGSDFVTTTATLDYGNSGGPLVDSAGRVIAMNTGVVSNTFYAVGTPAFLSNSWTLAAAPSVPRNFRIVSAVGTKLTVAWDAPVDEGADAISYYYVDATPGGSHCYARPPSTSCTLTNLVIGIPYTIYMFARNQFGQGQYVWLPSSFTPTVTKPDSPSNIKATWDGQAKAVTVSWTTPYDGGSPITGSVATLTPTGQSCVVAGTKASCTIGGVRDPESLSVMVAAENQQGRGAWGEGGEITWLRITECTASREQGKATFNCSLSGSALSKYFISYRVKPKKAWENYKLTKKKTWDGNPTQVSVKTRWCSGSKDYPTCSAVEFVAQSKDYIFSNTFRLKNVVMR